MGCGASKENSINVQKQKKGKDIWAKTGIVALQNAKLKDWPNGVDAVAPSIRVLDATNNSLSSFPNTMSTMTKCQRLLLSHNAFTHLSPAISHLANLKVLTIDHNQLTQLPPDIFQSLTSLQQLNISGNQLTCLPPSIGQLSRLIHLDASHNHLNSLPSLAGCTTLETLNLSYNKYKTVPGKSLAQLTSLKELDMEGNQIDSAAGADECKEVFQLPALQTLKLQGNPIDQATLESVAGYSEFEERRRNKYGKAIAAGVMMSSDGLTEAADRAVAGRGRL